MSAQIVDGAGQAAQQRPDSRLRRGRFHPERIADAAAVSFLLLIGVAILFPGLLTSYNPYEVSGAEVLAPPGADVWFGTDYLGRDLFSRVVYGTQQTIFGAFIAVVVGLGVGAALGLGAAYLGGAVDAVISRIVDVLLAIPGLLLAMVVIVALGFGTVNAAIAVGIASVATFARLMRSEVLRVRNLPFVEAARHLGVPSGRLMLHHVLPNSYGPVLSMTALQFGLSILWITALSFLGFGAPPPQPEWGLLVSEGRDYLASSWWMTILPGLVIVLTVLSISRVSQILATLRKDVS
ncbi:ABC transporter permease [Nesterenkonia muleiensis]|uniref:ABC transporter permease n=1 Tax=Nesterenkonia muleiensis TaxID=2282648 RepID=UPI000E74CBCF|nr:ABC transporter permease [Nesterenkonia muleiensis]